MKKLYLYILALSFVLALPAGMLKAQSLKGHISLNDSIPAEFATVHIPATGQVTTADRNGNYILENVPKGTVNVEYSYIGYKTIYSKLPIKESKTYILNQRMEPEVIALDAVFVTPDEDDMATYILKKIAQKAKENRTKLNYNATVMQDFKAKDADIVPMLLSKTTFWMLKQAVKVAGKGAIMDYVLQNRSVEVSVRTDIEQRGKKISWNNKKVIASNPTLSKKAESQLLSMMEMELFEIVYSKDNAWGEKGRKDYVFNVKGNIEVNGKTVYILEGKAPKSQYLTDKTIYVVDGDWGILRVDEKSQMSTRRLECRDIGDGIYMPITLVDRPSLMSFDKMVDKAKVAVDSLEEKPSRIVRKGMERAEELLQGERKFTPYASHNFSIVYSTVK